MELSFPSELGYEKIARAAVAAFAARIGFEGERIEDLKTALGEACINAIEHGNDRAPGLRVGVRCRWDGGRLTVEVHDQGKKRYQACGAAPGIERKVRGMAPPRGMGLILIAGLVDEAGFADDSENGNAFRFAIRPQA